MSNEEMCLRLYFRYHLGRYWKGVSVYEIQNVVNSDIHFSQFRTEYFDLKRKKKIQKVFKKEIEILKYFINKIQKLLNKCQIQSSKK